MLVQVQLPHYRAAFKLNLTIPVVNHVVGLVRPNAQHAAPLRLRQLKYLPVWEFAFKYTCISDAEYVVR